MSLKNPFFLLLLLYIYCGLPPSNFFKDPTPTKIVFEEKIMVSVLLSVSIRRFSIHHVCLFVCAIVCSFYWGLSMAHGLHDHFAGLSLFLPPSLLSKKILVSELLSASVERVGVSRKRDIFTDLPFSKILSSQTKTFLISSGVFYKRRQKHELQNYSVSSDHLSRAINLLHFDL